LSFAAERISVEHGETQLSISASVANEDALRLYRRLGYADAGVAPQRANGTIQLRSGSIEVDDTLFYLIKDLG
jgi:ribosomal protein S18 acetylase RimI-like enzyme